MLYMVKPMGCEAVCMNTVSCQTYEMSCSVHLSCRCLIDQHVSIHLYDFLKSSAPLEISITHQEEFHITVKVLMKFD